MIKICSALLAFLLITLATHLSYANTYRWSSLDCSIYGTRQDMQSEITSLVSIKVKLNASYLIGQKNDPELLSKGYDLIFSPKVPADIKLEIEKRLLPYISNWEFDIKGLNGAQVDLDYESIYWLLKAMGRNEIELTDDLTIAPKFTPTASGHYIFNLIENYRHEDVQMHLPLTEKNGLSYHLAWKCDRRNQSSKPIDLGRTAIVPLPIIENFAPVLASVEAFYETDMGAFVVKLKTPPSRAASMRYKVDGGDWSKAVSISSEAFIKDTNPLELLGSHSVKMQYIDAEGIKSAPIEAKIEFNPPKYITNKIDPDFRGFECNRGGTSGAYAWVSYKGKVDTHITEYMISYTDSPSESWVKTDNGEIIIRIDSPNCYYSGFLRFWFRDRFGFTREQSIYFP